jgi:DNA-binding transcriptional LysR family regulator
MIQRKLFTVHNHFYMSLDYLSQYGEPSSLEDLDNHRIITFGDPVPSYLGDINYIERLGRPDSSPRRSAMKVNAIYGMMQACRAGIGIAMLPDYVTESETTLRRVLTGVELPAYEAYFVYPPALKNSKRVGVFRDFLVTKAREWQF